MDNVLKYVIVLPSPGEWKLIGEATSKNYQQCSGFGDFDGDSQSELVDNYSQRYFY
jgi:hypothetical protein